MTNTANLVVAFMSCGRTELSDAMCEQLKGSRVVACDNGGFPPFIAPEGVATLRSETNRMWGPGLNYFMGEITRIWPWAEAVWFLNDDIIGCSADMAERLYEQLLRERAAIVSPAVKNSCHVTTMPRNRDITRAVRYIDMTAPMFSVNAWKRVGGLDTTIGCGWGLDIDWCHRAIRDGQRLLVDDREVVTHLVGQTTNSIGTVQEHSYTDWEDRFRQKWGRSCWELVV